MTRRSTILISEILFFIPFWLLPLIGRSMRNQTISIAEIFYSIFISILLATVTAYFSRTVRVTRAFLILIIGIGAFASIWTSQVWHSELSARAILAAIDTNNAEAEEFLLGRTNLSSATAILAFSAIVIPILVWIFQSKKHLFWQPSKKALLFCLAITPVVISIKLSYDASAPNIRQWKWFGLYAMGSDYPPAGLYLAFTKALTLRRQLNDIASETGPVEGARAEHSDARPKTYVVVIGESLSKYHMQLYGYRAETTPRLTALARSGELAVFRDVVAAEDLTLPSLSAALVIATGRDHKIRTIVDLFNSAGFRTYWISNQHNHGSFYDTGISRLVQSAQTQIWLNTEMRLTEDNLKQKYDGELIDKLKLVDHEKKDKVIFLHLIGSHFAYQYRYPTAYAQLSQPNTDACRIENEREMISHYDNSVRYNDEVVSEIIEEVRKVSGDSFVFYMSDHGEEIYDWREYVGHGGVSLSPYIAEVPFMIWLSPEYKRHHPELAASLSKEIPSRRYSARDLSSTLADLADVTFPGMDQSRSVVAPTFRYRRRIITGLDYDDFRSTWKPDLAHLGGFAPIQCQVSSRDN